MKFKVLLIIGLLLAGCATPHINREYREYTLNGKTVTVGMSRKEVRKQLGPPSHMHMTGSAMRPVLDWRYIVDGAKGNRDRTELVVIIIQNTVTALRVIDPAN